MIKIIKSPYICSFSKNNVDFEVQTDMYFKSIHVYPSITLEIVALPSAGEHFAVKWMDPVMLENQEIRLVAKAGTVLKNYEIADTTYAGTLTDYRDDLLEKLLDTPILNGLFSIEAVSTTKIKLTAVSAVSELIPEWETNQTGSKIEAVIEDDCVLPDTRTGYEMRALVYFEKEYLSGAFEMVADLNCVIDNDSKAFLDVSDVVDAEIENSWNQYPVPWTEEMIYKAPNLRRYYVKFIESWTGETEMPSIISDTLFAHWGGVSTDDQMMGDPISLITATNNFLTWWPDGKRIGETQEDWLGWMNLQDDATFEVVVIITSDGAEYEDVLQTIDLKRFETLILNTGWTANNLQSFIPGLTPQKWAFRVQQSGGSIISPNFTYYFDNACIRKVIMGFNSFGIPETFHTSGEWSENMNVSTEVASRSSAFGLSALFPQSFIFDSFHRNSMKAVTGFLKQEEAYKLQSVLNSMITYVLDDNRWVPCVIGASKTAVLTLNAFLVQIELEILKANENDRASFFPLQPDLRIVADLGIERIEVIDNGLDITTHGNILCYKDGALVSTFTWNAGLGYYTPGTAVVSDGEYRFVGTLSTATKSYPITKHFNYFYQEIVLSSYEVGLVTISLRSVYGIAGVIIDWGDGTVGGNAYGTSLTAINHTYTKTGKKVIRLSKMNFDDVLEFSVNQNFGRINFGAFKNLEWISYTNGASGNYYFSQLEKVKRIYFNGTSLTALEVGFQKNLEYVTIYATGISTSALDELIKELWNFRKLYAGNPQLLISGLGYTESSYFTSIKDGTGDFAGEGLVTDYGWTIMV